MHSIQCLTHAWLKLECASEGVQQQKTQDTDTMFCISGAESLQAEMA